MIIVGSSGRIAQRYKAILNYLQKDFYSYDVNFKAPTYRREKSVQGKDIHKLKDVPAFICTPSHTHYKVLEKFYVMGYRDFLIEKPLFTHHADYENARHLKGARISGICNYKYIDGKKGETHYNYFDAGQEKLHWNLFQIIALARNELKLESESPIWQCTLNGRKLSLEDVHKSYILQLEDFFKNPLKGLSLDEAEEWFFKVQKFVQKQLVLESKPDSDPTDSLKKSSEKLNQASP